MPPRARIGLALCAALFASPLFFACRSTSAESTDPEVQALSGHEAVEAMAMPENTTAQKKAKRGAIRDVVDRISGPIIDHRWDVGEFEFMPGNGTYVSTRVDRENICSM